MQKRLRLPARYGEDAMTESLIRPSPKPRVKQLTYYVARFSFAKIFDRSVTEPSW